VTPERHLLGPEEEQREQPEVNKRSRYIEGYKESHMELDRALEDYWNKLIPELNLKFPNRDYRWYEWSDPQDYEANFDHMIHRNIFAIN
jgi:hypothetical protein